VREWTRKRIQLACEVIVALSAAIVAGLAVWGAFFTDIPEKLFLKLNNELAEKSEVVEELSRREAASRAYFAEARKRVVDAYIFTLEAYIRRFEEVPRQIRVVWQEGENASKDDLMTLSHVYDYNQQGIKGLTGAKLLLGDYEAEFFGNPNTDLFEDSRILSTDKEDIKDAIASFVEEHKIALSKQLVPNDSFFQFHVEGYPTPKNTPEFQGKVRQIEESLATFHMLLRDLQERLVHLWD